MPVSSILCPETITPSSSKETELSGKRNVTLGAQGNRSRSPARITVRRAGADERIAFTSRRSVDRGWPVKRLPEIKRKSAESSEALRTMSAKVSRISRLRSLLQRVPASGAWPQQISPVWMNFMRLPSFFTRICGKCGNRGGAAMPLGYVDSSSPARVHCSRNAAYSSQFPTVLGNGMTSRMLPIPVRYMTQRSKPRPKPE